MNCCRSLLALIWVACAASAADLVTEAIPLTSRSAEEMLPVVRPLLEPGGSVSGVRNTLVVKTTPANLEQIRQALNGLDHKARSLVVRLKSVEESADANSQASVSGDMGYSGGRVTLGGAGASNNRLSYSGNGAHVQLGSSGTQTRHINSSVAQVRVVEGGQGFIQGGGFGFYVSPKLSGDQVVLDVSQQSVDSRGQSRGGTRTQLSGALGRWIPVSGIDGARTQGAASIGSRNANAARNSSRLYLRVDEAR